MSEKLMESFGAVLSQPTSVPPIMVCGFTEDSADKVIAYSEPQQTVGNWKKKKSN